MEMNHNSDTTPNNGPFLELLIEPETKYRFRYASEGGSHGGVAGRERKNGKKTYPTVQLGGYDRSNKRIFIRVSLCTEKGTHHVLQFKGKKSSVYRPYIDADLDSNYCAVFKDLTIIIPKKEDVYQALLDRKIESLGRKLTKSAKEKFESEHKEDIKKEAKEIFNSVVLKFDTFERPDVQICPSIYSDPICNQKDSSKGELKICRLSQVSGSCKGGDEIILLCEKVQKDNVKIKFFEDDENENRWEAYAQFSPLDVHYQVAITFKTPPYKANMEKRVAVCLERRGEFSEKRCFTYIPDDCPSKKRRKCVAEETFEDMLLPMNGSSNSSSGVVPDDKSILASFKDVVFQSSSSDSNSSNQQDQDSPSILLGSEFQRNYDLDLDFLITDLMDVPTELNGVFKEEPVNQSLPWDTEGNESYFPNIEENQSLRPIAIFEGQMDECMMDGGKFLAQMAILNIKDSNSDDEIPKKVSMKKIENKVLKDEQKKMEQFVPYIANRDRDGNTLLHLAVLYNVSVDRILQVIKMSNPDIINVQNNNKQTALHIAVEKNSAAVKKLLQNSANPSIKNAEGDNCCHIVCRYNFVNCLEYILYPRLCHALILVDFNYEGLTPLHVALKNNSVSCLDFLFRKCYYLIDFSVVDDSVGQTFLHYAVQYSPSYVSPLLKGGEIEINCIDFYGNTPLHIACSEENYEVVKQLLEAGADPGIRNSKHSDSNSDEGAFADEVSIGQTPADLTTDSNILKLLKCEKPLDVCLSDCLEDKESDRVFGEIAKNLGNLLDPGMRWKEFAMYVLDEKYVTSMVKCSEKPTKTILEFMRKNSGQQYIEQLIAVLEMVGWNDAVKITNESCMPL